MKVFITRQIPDQGIKMLQEKGYELNIYPEDQIIPREGLLKSVRGIDALLCLLTDKIDEEIFQAAGSQLKIVANYAVGFDNIDLEAAEKHNILVTNTPALEVTETVAEHTFALLIALAHRIPEADCFAKAEKYKGWSPTLLLGTDVYGKTLGIIGLGRIGFAVAQRAVKGFKMKVLYNDVKPNPDFEKEYGGQLVNLTTLLKESDFVSLHVPLILSTHHLISNEQLNIMKPTAFLINTARGPVVDEKALLLALKNKKIAGAALDVFECEPAIDCDIRDNLELKRYNNVILTPHTASATIEARQAMSRIAAENIIAALEEKIPPNVAKL